MTKKTSRANDNYSAPLKTVLADIYVLTLKTHGFHWNVEGKQFRELHLMFEDQYNALFKAADEVAERIRTLDVQAPGSFAQFKQLANISEATKVPSAMDMVEELAKDYETLEDDIKKALEVADDADDEGTEDMLTGLLRDGQKQAWMLRSVLRGK